MKFMKKIILIIISALFLFTACDYKNTCLSIITSELGLITDSVFIEINGTKLSAAKIPLHTNINMVFKGIDGFSENNGLINLGASTTVKDSSDQIIYHIADIFFDIDKDGVDYFLIKNQLVLTLPPSSLFRPNSCYFWENIIWDKNGPGKIKTKVLICYE